jgi:hypothetical protein
MAINLHAERILTIREAVEELPRLRGGKQVHRSTLYRWMTRGTGGARLESLKVGRTTVTSREALQRFAERESSPPPDYPQDPSSSALAAERELDRHGI